MVVSSAVGAIALAIHGMILICEVADAPVITGISKACSSKPAPGAGNKDSGLRAADLKSHYWGGENVEQLSSDEKKNKKRKASQNQKECAIIEMEKL